MLVSTYSLPRCCTVRTLALTIIRTPCVIQFQLWAYMPAHADLSLCKLLEEISMPFACA